MSSKPIVPATALSRYWDTFEISQISIGSQQYWTKVDPNDHVYWFVVVSLADLSVAAQATSASATEVPAAIKPYLDSSDHFLFFVANSQAGYNVPQGELATFLAAVGAGAELARVEQSIEQLGTGSLRFFSYVLGATMDTSDLPGFEVCSFFEPSILTMQFKPIEVDGKTTYAPIRL
jgi:hypothetical protein